MVLQGNALWPTLFFHVYQGFSYFSIISRFYAFFLHWNFRSFALRMFNKNSLLHASKYLLNIPWMFLLSKQYGDKLLCRPTKMKVTNVEKMQLLKKTVQVYAVCMEKLFLLPLRVAAFKYGNAFLVWSYW